MAARADRSLARVRSRSSRSRQRRSTIRISESNLKFSKATADVNPPERELDKIFDNRSGQAARDRADRISRTTATFRRLGESTSARAAAMCREMRCLRSTKPLEAPAGVRLTFKLVQNHGGWNSDDNQNNNLGRFRFSMTLGRECGCRSDAGGRSRDCAGCRPLSGRAEQTAKLFSYWRTTVPEWQEENRRIEALWQSHPQGATQLALEERESPRSTHRLERGNFLAPAEEVVAGRAGVFASAGSAEDKTKATASRLDFARWLADRRSPTTARSIVNRIWQAYFGTGLVATAEDLGSQGEPPSHPELLDWLAVELMDHNWSLKHIQRLIVELGDVSPIEPCVRRNCWSAIRRIDCSRAGPGIAWMLKTFATSRLRPAGC